MVENLLTNIAGDTICVDRPIFRDPSRNFSVDDSVGQVQTVQRARSTRQHAVESVLLPCAAMD